MGLINILDLLPFKPSLRFVLFAVDTRKAGQAIKYFHAHLAPELCIPTGLKPSIINAAYLIPSVMHHLDALLQASQLQKEIASAVPHCPRIPLLRVSFW